MKLHLLKTLCAAIAVANMQPACALEALEDDVMSQTTGEGIAFLPQDFSMVFRGAGTTNIDSTGTTTESLSDLFGNIATPATVTIARSKDVGYIRYIPVGPLTAAAVANTTAGRNAKADVFLYGLALSKGDALINSRINSTDTLRNITSWGTADNPWLLRVETEQSVPTFQGGNTNTNTGNVSYLALEAPLFDKTLPLTSALGRDAYNLKLAFWGDVFLRRSDLAEDMTATGTQFDVGSVATAIVAGRPNRLRFQAILDGFSVNGSRVQMFQTLAGAGTTTGTDHFGCGSVLAVCSNGALSTTSTQLNNTLGLAALLRFNGLDSSFLRLSTAVSSTETGFLETPAIGSTVTAPTFDANEGLRLERPRINLVLGQLYQPLIFDAEGKNLVLEIARLPKKAIAYNKIYTDYTNLEAGNLPTTEGTTCSYYYCGTSNGANTTPVRAHNASYQGQNATHSSIAIGEVTFAAYTGAAAPYGGRLVPSTAANPAAAVKFVDPAGVVTNLGTAAIDGFLVQHLKITTKGL